MTTQVELEHTESWKLESQYMGYTYDIKVSLPREAAPEKGFPCITCSMVIHIFNWVGML